LGIDFLVELSISCIHKYYFAATSFLIGNLKSVVKYILLIRTVPTNILIATHIAKHDKQGGSNNYRNH